MSKKLDLISAGRQAAGFRPGLTLGNDMKKQNSKKENNMKKTYTKKQIKEAISYWEKQLKSGNYRKVNE